MVLGVLAGALQYLNQATFTFGPPWRDVITFGLYVVAIIGVSPLSHQTFRNALHLPPGLATLVTVIATVLAAAILTFHGLSPQAKGGLEGVLAFLAFIGFGAAPVPAPAAAVLTK